MSNLSNTWFKLLTLFEQSNHLVKEGEWFEEDRYEFFTLKDQFLELIVKTKPEPLSVNFYYVPYWKYSNTTKDKAGDLMRSEAKKRPFGYYLSQVEPCSEDMEIPEKATLEIEVTCEDRLFSFHVPVEKTLGWDIDTKSFPKKTWISGKEFHRSQFDKIKGEIEELMKQL